ncbi:ubiquitin-like protein [Lactarius sanguifluus]|nr:ubiquitin-like protein [Lactarius sanguifluus]
MSQDPHIKPEVIHIKFVGGKGYGSHWHEVYFKTRRTTRFSLLQSAFANFVKKDVGNLRFSYNGTRVDDHDTPGSLDMEDNDTIDVMTLQISG